MKKKAYIDRKTGQKRFEKVYCERIMHFFYSNPFGFFLIRLASKCSFVSMLYGIWQKCPWTKKKISSFVKNYEINIDEYSKKLDEYKSFNDFFIRKLKEGVRPIDWSEDVFIAPADGRYLVYPDVSLCKEFVVKDSLFSLVKLLGDTSLAKRFEQGSMLLIRLALVDYHRFHFPCKCIPEKSKKINGALYSVHPLAIKKYFRHLGENKRELTVIYSSIFGEFLFLEIGALNVGTIHQTFKPEREYSKGSEKGFFSFGGSSIVILFGKDRIVFDSDLIKNSKENIETLCLMGQSLGKKF